MNKVTQKKIARLARIHERQKRCITEYDNLTRQKPLILRSIVKTMSACQDKFKDVFKELIKLDLLFPNECPWCCPKLRIYFNKYEKDEKK